MRVSLIGMSNIGKTYWAKRIAAEKGIEAVHCDALIEKRLGPELRRLGYKGLRDMAKWMGQPPEPRYEENSARYVACEIEAMGETLTRLEADPQMRAVIDTTGSVIYTGADSLKRLRDATRVVYLEASEAHIGDLFRRYIANPKPVIWGQFYAPQPGEAPRETLKRCYAELLEERARRYKEIAHVTIPFERHRNPQTGIGVFLP